MSTQSTAPPAPPPPPPAGQPPIATPIATPPAAPRLAVYLEHVYKRFGNVVGVQDLSFGVPETAIVGVIGPSGAGKTTTIRLMTGALKADGGTVRVLGEDPRHFSRRTRERIGYMPQLFVLYPDLTARENVGFMAALFGIPPWRRGRRVDEVLELVDLTEARNRRASDLSGGMQRRLELACALVHRPQLLVLDEPTAGIDPILRTRIWAELDRLRQTGVTVIVTTQYVAESEYCDQVAVISEGTLVAFAPPDELRRQAMGGDVLEIGTSAPFDARQLPPIEGVIAVRQAAPDQLIVTTTNAGVASPRINDAIDQAGGVVDYSREHRPTFDEVFAALVTAHSNHNPEAETIL
jgi:ABC-2 type transport system ATP-binding protein